MTEQKITLIQKALKIILFVGLVVLTLYQTLLFMEALRTYKESFNIQEQRSSVHYWKEQDCQREGITYTPSEDRKSIETYATYRCRLTP